MSTLMLCDDHRLVREALAAMLLADPGVQAVHEVGSGEEVLARYALLRPDAVVLDVRLPGRDGVTTAVELLRAHPDARVLLLSGEPCEEQRARALRAGAKGFLHKDIDADGLRGAVASVLAGADLLTRAQRRALEATPDRAGIVLSQREMQVLQGMADGCSNAQIGRSLWLSEDTVKVHAKKLFAKTGVHDRAHAVAWAFRAGVLV